MRIPSAGETREGIDRRKITYRSRLSHCGRVLNNQADDIAAVLPVGKDFRLLGVIFHKGTSGTARLDPFGITRIL